jgi:hypothetical protein
LLCPRFVLIQRPHSRLQGGRIAVAAISGHGGFAVALDAGKGNRIR